MIELWQVGQRIAFCRVPGRGEGHVVEVDTITASEAQYLVCFSREVKYTKMTWVWHQDVTGEVPVQLELFKGGVS